MRGREGGNEGKEIEMNKNDAALLSPFFSRLEEGGLEKVSVSRNLVILML